MGYWSVFARASRSFLVAALLFAPSGCAGESSDDSEPRSELSRYCTETRTSLAPDETSPFGFAASELMPLAAGTHTAELEWKTKSTLPKIPPSTVTMTVDFGTPVVEYIELTLKPGKHPEPNPCVNKLEIVASVTFSTSDGLFDEHWDERRIAYTAPESDAVVPNLVTATVIVEPDQIAGSFAPAYEPGWCLLEVQIGAEFRKDRFSGNVIPAFISPPCDPEEPAGAVAVGGVLGVWPPVTP